MKKPTLKIQTDNKSAKYPKGLISSKTSNATYNTVSKDKMLSRKTVAIMGLQ